MTCDNNYLTDTRIVDALVSSTNLSFYTNFISNWEGDIWNIDRKTLEAGWGDDRFVTCTISDLN